MDGITTLNSSTGSNYLISTLWFYALGIIFAIVLIMVIAVSIQDEEPYFLVMLLCFSFSLFFFRCGYSSSKLPAQTRYQITVEDSVSFNDFMEKYKIIKRNGKIYTVIERKE